MPGQLGDIESASQKRKQTSFDITNTPSTQRSLEPVPGGPARTERMQAYDRAENGGGSIADGLPGQAGNGLGQASTAGDQDYMRTGIGGGMAGGEIAMRQGANGVYEFTNDAQAVGGARAIPQGGIGGGMSWPGAGAGAGADAGQGQGLAALGSTAKIGNGDGTFSQDALVLPNWL